jgi:5-methylcytosine-specific restriction endonuclease McrA
MLRIPQMDALLREDNALLQFRDLLSHRTSRAWSVRDAKTLMVRVQQDLRKHERAPIPYEEALLLRLGSPLECARCGKRPPEIVLHMDHMVPASRGGPSHHQNLQFLCAKCNLMKSNKREVEGPWLELT